jgi:hypothetical protein
MKLPITIEYMSGESETYTVQPPEWAKWEQKTGSTISQAQEKIGMADLLFLAYHAMKRAAGGKPVKTLEIWSETVADVTVGDVSQKLRRRKRKSSPGRAGNGHRDSDERMADGRTNLHGARDTGEAK